jgi:hypothetical protein
MIRRQVGARTYTRQSRSRRAYLPPTANEPSILPRRLDRTCYLSKAEPCYILLGADLVLDPYPSIRRSDALWFYQSSLDGPGADAPVGPAPSAAANQTEWPFPPPSEI